MPTSPRVNRLNDCLAVYRFAPSTCLSLWERCRRRRRRGFCKLFIPSQSASLTALPEGEPRTSSDLASLGHLPQRGRHGCGACFYTAKFQFTALTRGDISYLISHISYLISCISYLISCISYLISCISYLISCILLLPSFFPLFNFNETEGDFRMGFLWIADFSLRTDVFPGKALLFS